MSKQDVIDYVMETPHNTNRAVLEGLVDTAVEESQIQADWDQNDPTAKDYIKNRICYEKETVTELGNTYAVWNELTTADRYTPISYKMNGTIYKDVVPIYSSVSGVYMYNGVAPYDHYIGVSTDNSSIDSGGVNFQFVKIENTVKQIDSKFIPTASPDWSVNDENDPSYVKNRIGYYAEKEAAEKSTARTIDVDERVTFILTLSNNIDLYTIRDNMYHLYLYYKAKRYPLVYDHYIEGNSTYSYKTIVPENNVFITFELNTSTTAKGAYIIFNNKSSRKIAIEPGDLYITIPDPVEIPYDLIPLASQQTRGGIQVDNVGEPDGTSGYLKLDPETERLWYSPSIMGNIHSNILSKTIVTNIADRGGKTLICGSSDDTVSALNLTASNFPVTVTYVGYEGTYPPTFIYLISTADGKRGRFTYAVSSQTLSPITWTFEGGGGGNSLFIITPTFNPDTETWSTDRTWDEVKAAVAKSINPNDYAMSFNEGLLFPDTLSVAKNSGGEITDVYMNMNTISPIIFNGNMVPEGFGAVVPAATYETMNYHANSSTIKFEIADSGDIELPIIRTVRITKSNNGTLVCDPPNTIELYGESFDTQNPASAQFICPLYYNGETYHFETGEKDSSNIVSFYFSTVSNGVYKRLKITQGQNGAADTVVMDKEINLNTATHVYDEILISSSTPNSTKKFKITVDDTGALTATEVTEA